MRFLTGILLLMVSAMFSLMTVAPGTTLELVSPLLIFGTAIGGLALLCLEWRELWRRWRRS